jgi:hypothetical protein
MKRFVAGTDRGQSTLFPECLDDWVDEDNPVRVSDVFVDALDLGALDFGGVDPKATGRLPAKAVRRAPAALAWRRRGRRRPAFRAISRGPFPRP